MVEILTTVRHFPIVPADLEADLRPIDKIEERSSLMAEHD